MDIDDEIDNYKNEVIRLKVEIEELERKKELLEWHSVGAVSFPQLSSSVSFSEPGHQHILTLKNQLSMLKVATGVSMNDVIAESLEDGSTQYVLKGSCYGILFQVQFREDMDGHRKDGMFHIDKVEIDSMEMINTELQNLLDVCEDESSIGLFFSVFVPYVRCMSDRRTSFASIRQKFPHFVNLSADTDLDGATLKFYPLNKRVTFEVHWNVDVNQLYTVTPVVRLTVEGIGSGDDVFSSSCEKFAEMVETLGPARAIDVFATSMCADLKQE